MILILASICAFVWTFMEGKLNLESGVILVVCAIAGVVFIKIPKNMRQEARQSLSSDKYGNRTVGYKNLSKDEKRNVDVMLAAQDERLLPESEFKTMVKQGAKNPEKELEELVGLSTVKQRVKELQALADYSQNNQGRHMCFLGNPGTGKTTVGRIITGFLYKTKYIKNNVMIYTDAANIVASGGPAAKLRLILQRSHGKVLFIDEAYAFANSAAGYEALTLLLNEMENHRDSLTVILAGYKHEMKQLFNLNSGLNSRFSSFLFFEDYTHEEMLEILLRIAAKDNFTISAKAQEEFVNLFIWQKLQSSFANARTVRTMYEDAKLKHFYRLKTKEISAEYKYVLLPEDIVSMDMQNSYLS